MNNFALIKTGIDTSTLLAALKNKPELWGTSDFRTTLQEAQHIFLRVNEVVTGPIIAKDVEFHETDAFWSLPEFQPIIFNTFSGLYGTRLGGCMIANLPAHSEIKEHSDIGPCALYYDARIHIVLQATDVDFYTGNEVVQMNTGEMWWFDYNKPHHLVNNSDTDRLHLILDIKSAFGRETLLKALKDRCLYGKAHTN